MTRRRPKIEACPVPGCDYEGLPSRVRLHVERKRDEAHRAHRDGSKPTPETPTPPSEEPPAPKPPPTAASSVEVDFGGARLEDDAAPLVDEPLPEAPPTQPEAPTETPPQPPANPSKPAPAPDPIVVDDESPVGTGPTGAPTPGAGAIQTPSLGDALMSPHLAGLVNRFVTGATNRWLIDATQGDTPLSPQEIEALEIPSTIAATLTWLEAKYGWRIDLDHPIVWWLMAGLAYGSIVSSHRAPRKPKDETDDEPAHQDAGTPAPPPPPAPSGPLAAQLEALTR